MIVIFGGTTEGRKAVEVLEEAGQSFYYSTKTGEQTLSLHHGVSINGEKDSQAMQQFCSEHDIRLLIDAAHPFATQLHETVAEVAKALHLPLIRYERIYPPHTDDITWCHDYDDAIQKLEISGIETLLMLTGVQTIERLKPYWQKHHCWCRILDRDTSRQLAAKHGFPKERLIYYPLNDEDNAPSNEEMEEEYLITSLHPQAILTKESGLSGGFHVKVAAALHARVKVFVVERPRLSYQSYHLVNGPHGLRRTVEHLLPDFFPLKSGLTTGTCATAAAVAATHRLLHHKMPAEVPVILPNGETISVRVGYGSDYAFCIKDAGDDPDVTNGIEIRATAETAESFDICAGVGIGAFTLPGFDYPPGEPAINKGPRQMIRDNIAESVRISLSVPGGAEIARRTFNPRLGIEGGISIIGVSGIVKPFSEEAFIESIRKCMQVAKASGTDRVVIGSGAKSEGSLRARYPDLPRQAFVQYGNFIGETLRMADEQAIANVTLGIMLGKAVKLAAGQLDTHSRKATMDKVFIQQMLDEARCGLSIADVPLTLARELWELIPAEKHNAFARVVVRHCMTHCRPLLPHSSLTILLIDENGNIY